MSPRASADAAPTIAQDPFEVARRWLDVHGRAAMATVIETWSSAPVPVGGVLCAAPGDRFQGSVSGGCVEADVIHAAGRAMEHGRPEVLEFGVSQETAWKAGLPCGGAIKVLVEPLRRESDTVYLDAILEARRTRQTLVVLKDLATGRRQIHKTGDAASPEIASRFQSGQCGIIELADGRSFAHVLLPAIRLVIVGATEIGQILTDLAHRIGYQVVVVDPRGAYATRERMGATALIEDWPAAAMETLGIDDRTAVVALTHSANLDDEALAAALQGKPLYIGALGSRRSHASRLERLTERGFDPSDLQRIHAPVGLAIGARTPAEIALSILAQVVQIARAR